jgi:translation elongation factor EF-Ts
MNVMMDKFKKFLEQEYQKEAELIPLDKASEVDIPRANIESSKVKGFYVEPELDNILEQLAAMKKRKGIKSDIINAALRKYFKDLELTK